MAILKIIATAAFAFLALLMFGNSIDLAQDPEEWPKQVLTIMILMGSIVAIIQIWA